MKRYVNKAGHMYKGSKPDGMSDAEFEKMMVKKGYKAMSKAEEAEEADEDEDDDDADESGNEEDGYKKSLSEGDEVVEVSALSKALDTLSNLVDQSDPETRKEALLQKSMEGDLTEWENQELLDILAGGEVAAQEGLAKSVLSGLNPELNEDLEKSIEVSEYLRAHHQGTVEAVTELADTMEKSQAKTDQFQLVLAKAIVSVGRELENLSKSIDGWGNQPLSQRPRSAQTHRQAKAQVMEKSFAGGTPEGQKLSRTDVMNVLESMNRESFAKGNNGLSASGEDLTVAISKYEQTNRMSKALAAEVISRAQSMRAAS